jgi:hypothetical protein
MTYSISQPPFEFKLVDTPKAELKRFMLAKHFGEHRDSG